jgi:hypothetical protein
MKKEFIEIRAYWLHRRFLHKQVFGFQADTVRVGLIGKRNGLVQSERHLESTECSVRHYVMSMKMFWEIELRN